MVEVRATWPMGQIEFNVQKADGGVSEAPLLCVGFRLVTGHCPGYDHITSAIRRGAGGWHGTAML